MSTTSLTVISGKSDAAARAQVAWKDARQAASDHVQQLFDAMEAVRVLSLEVAGGGDAYPVGLRAYAAQQARQVEMLGNAMAAVAK